MAAPSQGSLKRGTRLLLNFVYRVAQHLGTCDISRLLWLDAARCSPPLAAVGYTFRFLTADELGHFARDPANHLDPTLAERLKCGQDQCFAALHEGELASYFFLATGSIEAEHNRGRNVRSGLALSYAPQIAYAYNAFTLPEHRGRGLYPTCMARALDALAEQGVTQLLTTTDWYNARALAGCRKLGFEDLGATCRIGVGALVLTKSPTGKAPRLGIRFGRHAIVEPRVPQRRGVPIPKATPDSAEAVCNTAP